MTTNKKIFFSACLVVLNFLAVSVHAIPLINEPATGNEGKTTAKIPAKVVKEIFSEQPSAGFVCPNADTLGATECFLDATEHLYTVCRHVKAIELIEYGFEKARDTINNTKSDYCRNKQKVSMPRYFEAALREAQNSSSCATAHHINQLYAVWTASMIALKQLPDETEQEYQRRIDVPYRAFAAYKQHIRDTLVAASSGKATGSCEKLVVFKP